MKFHVLSRIDEIKDSFNTPYDVFFVEVDGELEIAIRKKSKKDEVISEFLSSDLFSAEYGARDSAHKFKIDAYDWRKYEGAYNGR